MDLPAEFFLDTVRVAFHDHELPRGEMTWRDSPVEPRAITRTALMTIEGELDDISGAGQTRAAHDLCTGIPKEKQFHFDVPGAGHYGIFSGRKWRETIYPKIHAFIRKHA